MSRPRVLVLGEKSIDENLRPSIRNHLTAIGPSLVMSDFAVGWNFMVAEEARKLNMPVMAVLPHLEAVGNKAYRESRRKLIKESTNKIVFGDTYYDFLRDPKPYVVWLRNNVDAVLAYLDPSRSSTSHSIMVVLGESGKTIFNTHKE